MTVPTTLVPNHRHGLRGGTSTVWGADNPILDQFEIGWESDTQLMKIGDGSTAWNDLPYANRGPAGSDTLAFSNGSGKGTLSWDSGASSVDIPTLSGGQLSASVIPAVALSTVFGVADEAAMLALAAQEGDVAVRSDNSTTYMLGSGGDPTVLADWIVISPPGAVNSVNGYTGVVTLAASDVGAVPTSRTVNSKALSADVTLTASDVGALDPSDARVAPDPTTGTAGQIIKVNAGATGYELGSESGGAAPTWTTPTITGTVTPPNLPLRYCKDSAGWVHIEGDVKVGGSAITASTVLFTLPSGMRPTGSIQHVCYDNGTFANHPVYIGTDGTVKSTGNLNASTDYIFYISFYVG